ncbi:HHIP-like protein 1 [Styela clava]
MAIALLIYFCVMAFQQSVLSHPQCLDFTFPFKSSKALEMCSEYQEFGCCNRKEDNRIIDKYYEYISNLPSDRQDTCSGWTRDLLCQKCSPYAAHIFDAEDNALARTFPGLCPSYCIRMLNSCPDIVKFFTDNSVLLNLIETRKYKLFCDSVTTRDPDYCYPDLVVNPELSENLGKVEFYQAKSKCIPICLQEIANRRSNPVSAKHSRDGTHRLFIVEQLGLVWVILPDNSRLDPPFLDLRDVVVANKQRYDERGMLDIEFHPNYRENGLFYLYYSFSIKGKDYVKISEMKVSDNDMNKANATAERTLLEIRQPAKNHNGGQLLFLDGVDENLYIFTGDGGNGGDPFGKYGNGQNKKTFLGKVLRINVNARGVNGHPYAIPSDNPFVEDSAYLPEIYALGVRNMWRCSMDRGNATGSNRGRVFCGDVGQSAYEEVDIIEKGGNYGWRGYEGYSCYDKKMCNSNIIKNYIRPIHAYSHSVGKSVTGGYVYRGCQNPNLRGKYIFGDFHNGKLFALTENSNGSWKRESICMASNEACKSGGLQNNYGKHILSFGEDENGELYMLSTPRALPGFRGGSVYRLVDPSSGGDPSECSNEIVETEIMNRTEIIPYQSPSDSTVSVRLAGSNGSKHRGRVEIILDGDWGTICDDEWGIQDAQVICRMLGFHHAKAALKKARFGRGSGPIWLDDVRCSGTETNIANCHHSPWGYHNCGHAEDASVVCSSF